MAKNIPGLSKKKRDQNGKFAKKQAAPKKDSKPSKKAPKLKVAPEPKAAKEEREPFLVEDVAQALIDAGSEGLWATEVQELTEQETAKLARQTIRKARYLLAERGYHLISIATDPEKFDDQSGRTRIYRAVKKVPTSDETLREYAVEA